MKQLTQKMLILIAVVASFFAVATPLAGAQSARDAVCRGVTTAGGTCTDDRGIDRVIDFVIDTLSVIVGIASVIFIIIGGFKYVTSAGDSSNVQSAKNTILYAIVGLVVVALAQTITGFVLDRAT
jgi:hypothetical protein